MLAPAYQYMRYLPSARNFHSFIPTPYLNKNTAPKASEENCGTNVHWYSWKCYKWNDSADNTMTILDNKLFN